MIKKGVSLLMALALCLTLLPASALAAEAQGQAGQEQTVLTQGNDGQTQAPGRDGAGEDDKTSDEAPNKAPDEEPDEAVSAVQALIDALPAAEDISDANADEVSGQLDAIDEAKLALTEEQATQLDFAKYDAAAAAVLALLCALLLAGGAFGYVTLDGKLQEKQAEIDRLQEKTAFFDRNAVCVNDDGSMLYHRYGCARLEPDQCRIYSRKTAEAGGYEPCPDCFGS